MKLILVLLLFCQQASSEPDTSEAQVSENTGKTVLIGIEESLYDDSDIQKSICISPIWNMKAGRLEFRFYC